MISKEQQPEEPLPPRVKKHPPEFIGITYKFHVTLLVLFLLLMLGLVVWYYFYIP